MAEGGPEGGPEGGKEGGKEAGAEAGAEEGVEEAHGFGRAAVLGREVGAGAALLLALLALAVVPALGSDELLRVRGREGGRDGGRAGG
jgi:hypothetical protein